MVLLVLLVFLQSHATTTGDRTKMSSASNLSLTLVQRTSQSTLPGEIYSYSDAFSDAVGTNLSEYSGSPGVANNTLFLWESGCRVNGTWNCTLACSESETAYSMVWNSSETMFTLHNCLLYPIIATAAFHGWLVEDPPGLLDKFTISSNVAPIDVAADFSENEAIWSVVNGCLVEMCYRTNGYAAKELCSLRRRDMAYLTLPGDIP